MEALIAKPAVPNLEFSVDEMRRMADAVGARSIEHVASLAAQPVLGDVNAHEFCRSLREPAPEKGSALEPLPDQLFEDCIPRSFNSPAPGYLARPSPRSARSHSTRTGGWPHSLVWWSTRRPSCRSSHFM